MKSMTPEAKALLIWEIIIDVISTVLLAGALYKAWHGQIFATIALYVFASIFFHRGHKDLKERKQQQGEPKHRNATGSGCDGGVDV